MGVYLPIKDYSAMQGPAPSGFHVPLNTEWQAVRDIRVALGGGSSAGTNFGIALKLPFAGYRSNSSAGVNGQGSYGNYRSSSRNSNIKAYNLNFNSTALNPQNSFSRAYGYSVRCFKNSPVIPTSSWTKLYGTSIEAGGIFLSSTDGLISLSSDGTNWITIADKNLGATTVWNSGDTLSEANCGKYYQRGNNYGFPRTGTITNQSTTQVDASNYGPGNYYSSDTFIKYSGRWDTTDNGNLWGGVTGVSPMSELKNAYIGEVWTPGANTIAYYPLTSTSTIYEQSGKNKPLTNTGVTFGTYKGVDCAYLDGSHFLKNETSYGLSGSFTALIWAYYVKISNIDYEQPRFYGDDNGNIGIWIEPVNVEIGYNPRGSETRQTLASDSGWKLLTVVYDGTNCKLYVNNANVDTTAKSGYTYTDSKLGIGGYVPTPLYWKGGLSEFILENRPRTAQEISNYYNLTKSNYGL